MTRPRHVLEARESFKQEALASWAAYKETGRHLTGQEVRTWLSTWGINDERAVRLKWHPSHRPEGGPPTGVPL